MQAHSRRAKRMERHHKRHKKDAGLNMISLMDIFTILVFFLLVNSSSVQDLPSTKQIKLPESIADKLPKETVVIVVNNTDILVQGNKIVDVKSVMNSENPEIAPLKLALLDQAKRVIVKKAPDDKPANRDVTIMGDKEIPYKLLKKIMYTCTLASYGNISLAVTRKLEQNG
jgi:biopolymer transport protein ExbD